MKKASGQPGRRQFLATALASVTAPFFLPAIGAKAAEAGVVETANGKVRGALGNGAISFKGIPYAADTGGRNRFMAPRPMSNWAGVRDTLTFGDRCVQGAPPPGFDVEAASASSENCCVLNIYTPDLNQSARRPVMFWIHGGGFEGGSGEVNGSNLAKIGDVVVVAINHRLNIFGYASLAYLHPDFADSSNVGQLDLIAALNWVKTNIHAFGGDPQNITVFGQSGGGSKIMTMGVMPRANGLFRRSINMSGDGAMALKPPASAEPVMDEFLKVLEISRRDAHKLQGVPPGQLFAAYKKAQANLHADQLRPAIDGRNVRYATMSPEGLAMQAALPAIMSTTATEASAFIPATPQNTAITFEQLKPRVMAQFGIDETKAAAVIDGYRQDDPRRTPWEVMLVVGSEAMVRAPMRHAAEALANVRREPVYFLDFNYMVDPVRGAPHAADIAYAFGNQALGRNPKTGPVPAAVAVNEMSTFVAFARTGNPNNPRIPQWAQYDTATRPTLVMEEHPRLVDDFRSGDRRTSDTLPALETFQVTAGPLVRP